MGLDCWCNMWHIPSPGSNILNVFICLLLQFRSGFRRNKQRGILSFYLKCLELYKMVATRESIQYGNEPYYDNQCTLCAKKEKNEESSSYCLDCCAFMCEQCAMIHDTLTANANTQTSKQLAIRSYWIAFPCMVYNCNFSFKFLRLLCHVTTIFCLENAR